LHAVMGEVTQILEISQRIRNMELARFLRPRTPFNLF
jgi:hypothetical protein